MATSLRFELCFELLFPFLKTRNVVNDNGEIKPRSLRFTWSMKTTSSRDPNEIMAEIKKVCITPNRMANMQIQFYFCSILKE